MMNNKFKNLLQAFENTQNENTFSDVVNGIFDLMFDGTKFLIPIDDPEGMENRVKSAHETGIFEVGPEEDLGLNMRVLEEDDGTMWLPVFTDLEEVKKGDETICIEDELPPVIEYILQNTGDGMQGILLNPWSAGVALPCELLEEFGTLAMQNRIFVTVDDITKLEMDAIVNAANNTLLGGSGVDGAIHRAAGPELLEECRMLHGCKTGEVKMTNGYHLPSTYVLHTVGPIYSGAEEDAKLLENCYWNTLEKAAENDLHSVAFPCISTGVYGYPKDEAAKIAVETVDRWLRENEEYGMLVVFCLHTEADLKYYDPLMEELEKRIEEEQE